MSTPPPSAHSGKVEVVLLLLTAAFVLVWVAVAGVLSFFFLGADARALRNGFLESVEGRPRQVFAVNVGPATAGLARFGARWFNPPPEAQAGIDAFRGAEVGVYRLAGPRPDPAAAFASMDRRMERRGWERLVGVRTGREWVAVYVPHEQLSVDRVRFCFLVLHADQLVVGAGRASLRSILELPQVQEGLDSAFGELRGLREEAACGIREMAADWRVEAPSTSPAP
jgi:hypothetical protein